MLQFEFATATRILFGAGKIGEVPALAADMGRRAFIITGRSAGRAERLAEALRERHILSTVFHVVHEPETVNITDAVNQAREFGSDLVIAIGGGSAIDSAKAVAAMLTNPGVIEDYLEIVGKGQAITQMPAPCIAVPTTAGTGAEVTHNAVISVPEQAVKVSMRSPLMLPRLAVVDPELTYSLPPDVTASTGLDALTQLIEAFLSNKANPLTDGLCREGMQRAGRSLRRAVEDGTDTKAREDMALAALFGGLALANAKLGAVHGIAGPLGGMIPAPHGVICARLLPHVMEANVRALRERAAGSPALSRTDEVARILTGNPQAVAEDGVQWIQELCAALQVPSLSRYGLHASLLDELIVKSQKASSMQGNPVKLEDGEVRGILEKAL